MKFFLIYFLFTVTISCQSCYREFYKDSRIQEEMDIVMGLLAPDSSYGFVRENAVEVFVGTLVPTDIHNRYSVFGMQDSLLKELMINTRQFYVAYYDYDPSATVTIEGAGQSVTLTYVNRGIYRDVNRELTILPSNVYDLKVEKKDGRVFTARTHVLGPIQITNSFLDTTLLQVHRTGVLYFDTVLVRSSSENRAIYYVLHEKNSNIPFSINSYSFQPELYDAVVFAKNEIDTTHINYVTAEYESRSIDSAYGLFHQPHGHSMTPEFGDWDITLYDIPILERSNIKGKNVVGVFGNYSADRKKVVYKADW